MSKLPVGWASSAGVVSERLLFRKGTATQPVSFDSWTTDAAAWFVRGEPGPPQLLAALGVTNLKRGNEIWFASEQPRVLRRRIRAGARH